MKNKFHLILFALVLISIGFASSLEDVSCQSLESQKSMLIGQKIPEKVPFSNEVLNVYLEEKIFGSLIIENKTISDFNCLGREDATYLISIKNSDVINDFIDSEDFIGTYNEKSESGEIVIKGIGLGKKIKLVFVKFLLRFA